MKYIRYVILWLGLMPFVFFGAFECFKIFLMIEYAMLAAVIYYLTFIVLLNNLFEEQKKKN